MSTRGIYAALSGAVAQAQRLDTIANNIANVNTPGFKRDEQVFREYLTANEKPPEVIQVPKVPGSLESFYDMQGGDLSYVDANGTFTEFTQGRLQGTNGSLDVAIDGSGFFEVMTPGGLRLSRYGSFSIDGNGQLVNKDGFPVMMESAAGADPASRVVRISGEAPISIAENGQVFEGENLLGRLSVVDVANKDNLQKIGQNLFDFKKNALPETTPVLSISLKQGFLELSNVNIVKEMTDMITATRTFETAQKAIKAYDSMAEKISNVIPKLGQG